MKKFIATVLCFAILFAVAFPVYASDAEPYSNNVNCTESTFIISSNGKATVNVSYLGKTGVVTSAKIETKIQRKVGLIWITVDGAHWTDTTTATDFLTGHSIQLTKKGTYRAHIKYTISGTGGSDDKIPIDIERVYS